MYPPPFFFLSQDESLFLSPLANAGVNVENITEPSRETVEFVHKLIDELEAVTPKPCPPRRVPRVNLSTWGGLICGTRCEWRCFTALKQ